MADEQEFPQNAQGEVDIPLHGPASPPSNRVSPAPDSSSPASAIPAASPVTPVAGTQISPNPIAQPASNPGTIAAPTTLQPQPAPPQIIQPSVQGAAPPTASPAIPTANLQTNIKLQWCPSCQVGVSKPEVGNVCPACGTPLVPIPPEYGPED